MTATSNVASPIVSMNGHSDVSLNLQLVLDVIKIRLGKLVLVLILLLDLDYVLPFLKDKCLTHISSLTF